MCNATRPDLARALGLLRDAPSSILSPLGARWRAARGKARAVGAAAKCTAALHEQPQRKKQQQQQQRKKQQQRQQQPQRAGAAVAFAMMHNGNTGDENDDDDTSDDDDIDAGSSSSSSSSSSAARAAAAAASTASLVPAMRCLVLEGVASGLVGCGADLLRFASSSLLWHQAAAELARCEANALALARAAEESREIADALAAAITPSTIAPLSSAASSAAAAAAAAAALEVSANSAKAARAGRREAAARAQEVRAALLL